MSYRYAYLLSDTEHRRLMRRRRDIYAWLTQRFSRESWFLYDGYLETLLYCNDRAVAAAFSAAWLCAIPSPCEPLWRQAHESDLPAIQSLRAEAPIRPPEHPETLAKLFALYEEGFAVLEDAKGRLRGYGIAFPWKAGEVPPADAPVVALPEAPGCLYLHGCQVYPAWADPFRTDDFVQYAVSLARSEGVEIIAAVSTLFSDGFLHLYKFRSGLVAPDPGQLAAYGSRAAYLTAVIVS